MIKKITKQPDLTKNPLPVLLFLHFTISCNCVRIDVLSENPDGFLKICFIDDECKAEVFIMASYFTAVWIVTVALTSVIALLTLHFIFFAIVGIFARKTFPATDKKLKYGIIIPARNEEAVVANLIESVYRNQYPQDKLQVFVIAHNCTDRTAEIARAAGATVYEYNNPDECTMGYAFRYLFDRIREDWGVDNYDGFFLFNADNILDEHYFEKMNDAFVACDKKSVITSFRDSKNFGSNVMSAMYGLYFVYGCRLESRGRTALGCSTRVQGTGYVINSKIVQNGWPYVTLTEDWEFTADRILLGESIKFCDDAVFYDEQPTGFRVMWRQRLRWARGHLLVCVTRFVDIVKSLFTPKKKGGNPHKVSTYDIMVNISPLCIISAALFVLNLILIGIVPLFIDVSAWKTELLQALRFIGISSLISYLTVALSAVLIYIIERKRIHDVSLGVKILSILVWPLFLFLSIPMEVIALFARNLGWKPIPHNDTTTFSDLNKKKADEPTDASAPIASPGESVSVRQNEEQQGSSAIAQNDEKEVV